MEDIDAAFSQTMNREEVDEIPSGGGHHEKRRNQPPPPSTSKVTLSGLLNALDGVGAQEGRILFATTNKYKALDPALCRPGRMDIHVEFKLASKYQAQELYRCFYLPNSGEEEDTASPSDEMAARSAALSEKNPPISGHSHRLHTLNLSRAEVDVLAARFADVIPEREFSMASLQGYLMTFKIRPEEAIQDAPAWIEQERAEKAKQGKASHAPVVSRSGSTEGDVEEDAEKK